MKPMRILSDVERTTLRRAQTSADAKYSIGGRLKETRTRATPVVSADRPEKPCRTYNRTLVIKIDQETLWEITRRALKDGASKAEQVRLLLEWGLEADNAIAT